MKPKQIEEIRTSVHSYMDFKVREVMEDIIDAETENQIIDSLDEDIVSGDEFLESVQNGEMGGFPEKEIVALVEKLTESYMNQFKIE